MIGGAAGSALRVLAGRAGVAWLGARYPYGTLFVNVTGGLAMGLLMGAIARHPAPDGEAWRMLLGVGLLGGYTTFSSFSLETVTMIQRGEAGVAIGYVLVSALGAIGAVAAGLAAVRAVSA